jgi:hypothetical protein
VVTGFGLDLEFPRSPPTNAASSSLRAGGLEATSVLGRRLLLDSYTRDGADGASVLLMSPGQRRQRVGPASKTRRAIFSIGRSAAAIEAVTGNALIPSLYSVSGLPNPINIKGTPVVGFRTLAGGLTHSGLTDE